MACRRIVNALRRLLCSRRRNDDDEEEEEEAAADDDPDLVVAGDDGDDDVDSNVNTNNDDVNSSSNSSVNDDGVGRDFMEALLQGLALYTDEDLLNRDSMVAILQAALFRFSSGLTGETRLFTRQDFLGMEDFWRHDEAMVDGPFTMEMLQDLVSRFPATGPLIGVVDPHVTTGAVASATHVPDDTSPEEVETTPTEAGVTVDMAPTAPVVETTNAVPGEVDNDMAPAAAPETVTTETVAATENNNNNNNNANNTARAPTVVADEVVQAPPPRRHMLTMAREVPTLENRLLRRAQAQQRREYAAELARSGDAKRDEKRDS